MKFVEPIRSRKKIAQIKNLLRGQRRYRDLFLFVVGINSALRISDLLTLRIGHFVDEQGQIKHRFQINEQYELTDYIIRPDVEYIVLFQFEDFDEIMERGYHAGQLALEDWRDKFYFSEKENPVKL